MYVTKVWAGDFFTILSLYFIFLKLQLWQVHASVLPLLLLDTVDDKVNPRHEAGTKQEAQDATNITNQIVEVIHIDLGLNWSRLTQIKKNTVINTHLVNFCCFFYLGSKKHDDHGCGILIGPVLVRLIFVPTDLHGENM